MNRFDIINELIAKHNFKSYLEIGTQQSISGHQVKIKNKTGVDPAPMERKEGDYQKFHQVTSDFFFTKNKRKFDIIFIDGDHSYKQSRTDLINAMQCLNDAGFIVMHDCLPHNKEYTSLLWNGEVFKTINDLHNSGAKYEIYQDDHGCAVIPKQDLNLSDSTNLTYEEYNENKKLWSIL